MSLAAAPTPSPAGRRRLGGAGLLLLVLVWHAWLLGQWPGAARSSGSDGRARSLAPPSPKARPLQLVPLTNAHRAEPDRAAMPETRVPAMTLAAPARRSAPPAEPVPMRHPLAVAPASGDAAALPAAPEPPGPNAAADVDGEAPVSGPDGIAPVPPPPIYPTATPAPAQLRYALQIGVGAAARTGEATLSWQHDGERYRLALVGQDRGVLLVTQTSSGVFDAAGLAPERFVDQRRGRGARSANFERDSGRIRFSGPRTEYPAWPGVQDRLGWIVQLAAIAQAAGAVPPELSLFVVDARGAGGLWTFKSQGGEPIATRLGLVQAVKLLREPQQPYDWRVEAWLDPQRGYWPARLRMTLPRSGAVFDLGLVAEPTP